MWCWNSVLGINVHHSWWHKIYRNDKGGENTVEEIESSLLISSSKEFYISLKNQAKWKPMNH